MSTGEVRALVDVVLQAASMHGSTVKLRDLLRLVPEGTSAEELMSVLAERSGLMQEFTFEDGELRHLGAARASRGAEDRSRAAANIGRASGLSSMMRGDDLLMMAISGSRSYPSAHRGDDTDLFCVARTGRLWVLMTKGLILSRVFRLLRPGDPPIDFSCMMDEAYALWAFGENEGALFARDALMAMPIAGEAEYVRLLKAAPWMEAYFPGLYRQRAKSRELRPERKERPASAVLNSALFFLVGGFVRLKAGLHNRQLAKHGGKKAIFRLRIGRDHLFYESVKYTDLRTIYSRLTGGQPAGEALQAAPGR